MHYAGACACRSKPVQCKHRLHLNIDSRSAYKTNSIMELDLLTWKIELKQIYRIPSCSNSKTLPSLGKSSSKYIEIFRFDLIICSSTPATDSGITKSHFDEYFAKWEASTIMVMILIQKIFSNIFHNFKFSTRTLGFNIFYQSWRKNFQ